MQADWGGMPKEGRKTDSRWSALVGQCPCQHAASYHDCCDWMWIWNPSSSPIFSWYGSFWMLSVPKTEIPPPWYTVWKQWRRHRVSKLVLGDQEKAFYFEGIRKLEQRCAKCIVLREEYIKKKWSNFLYLVAWSTRGQDLFIIPRMVGATRSQIKTMNASPYYSFAWIYLMYIMLYQLHVMGINWRLITRAICLWYII